MKLKYTFIEVTKRIKDAIAKGQNARERDIKWLKHYNQDKKEEYLTEQEKAEKVEAREDYENTRSEAINQWRNS